MPKEEVAVPLAHETAEVSTRRRETGRVRVSVTTGTETRLLQEVLRGRRAEVERVPLGHVVAEAPMVREEDGTIVIPVLAEELFVERRLVLVEEVRVRLVETEQPVEQPVELRVQRAGIERLDAATPDATSTDPPDDGSPQREKPA